MERFVCRNRENHGQAEVAPPGGHIVKSPPHTTRRDGSAKQRNAIDADESSYSVRHFKTGLRPSRPGFSLRRGSS